MNLAVLKALVLDALYQVLDNSVFRILAALVALPVLTTFVLGFREDGIHLLFGLKTWRYEDLIAALGSPPTTTNLRQPVIESILELTFNYLAGGIGVLFCIAATAFFVPSMIEKGAADVLFHKPVSRTGLYLSRYLAGLLFVALLSTCMVVGMYLGLRLVSGYDDPGILFAALALTYLFGLVHGVSMLVGVVTRSTVAAILLTLLFFTGNGCVQWTWRQTQQNFERRAELEEPAPEPGPLARVMLVALDVMHDVLPKTNDAAVIARKLRKSLDTEAFRDPETRFQVTALPPGFHRVPPGDAPLARSAAHLDALGEPLFLALGPDGERVELWRREKRTIETPRPAGSVRTRPERLSEATELLQAALVEDWSPTGTTLSSLPRLDERPAGSDEPAASFPNQLLSGELSRAGRTLAFQAVTFSYGSRALTLYHEAPAGSPGGLAAILERASFDQQRPDWYYERMDWSAEAKYNLWVSVAASLLFAAAVLGLGAWRLARIDF